MKKIITSIAELRELTQKTALEFRLCLKGGLFSRKTIKYHAKTKKFSVLNHIDDSKQYLTARQIQNKNHSNIGEAIKKHALILNH